MACLSRKAHYIAVCCTECRGVMLFDRLVDAVFAAFTDPSRDGLYDRTAVADMVAVKNAQPSPLPLPPGQAQGSLKAAAASSAERSSKATERSSTAAPSFRMSVKGRRPGVDRINTPAICSECL